MTDIPIIMSAPMVCALIREVDHPGTGKTMTRRLAWERDGNPRSSWSHKPTRWQRVKAGDRLWVRENLTCVGSGTWRYAADNAGITMALSDPRACQMIAWAHHEERGSVPSIHMPRWASRLTLIVTETKTERLQDISKADVMAEGIRERNGLPLAGVHAGWHEPFAQLWENLHGAGAWSDNPEVVAVRFGPHLCNIDAMPKAVAA